MHKSVTILLFCCLLFRCAVAQVTFQKEIAGMGKLTFGLAQTDNGDYLVGGASADKARCARILRLNALGEPIWGRQVCFDETDDFLGSALDHVAAATDGSVRVVFHKNRPISTGGSEQDVFLSSMSAEGSVQWTRKLTSKGRNTAGWWPALSLDAAGNTWFVSGDRIWYSGWTTSRTSDFDLYKINADGTKINVKRFQISKENRYDVRGVYAPSSDEIYVYGIVYQNSFSGIHDGFLVKFDGNSTMLWRKVWSGLHFQRMESVFSNGDLMAVGRSSNFNSAIARISRDGQMVWAKTIQFGTNQYFSPYQAKLSADKRHIFVAADLGRGLPDSATVYCFDEQARFQWGVGYGTCRPLTSQQCVTTADGGFALLANDNNRILLLKADSTGKIGETCPHGQYQLPPPRDLVLTEDAYIVTFETPTLPADEKVEWSSYFPVLTDYCSSEFPYAAIGMPDSVCVGSPVKFKREGNNNFDRLSWIFTNGMPEESELAQPDSVRFDKVGVFPIRLIQHYGNCSDTAVYYLKVIGPTAPIAFTDTLICPGLPLRIRLSIPSTYSVRWNDGNRDSVRSLMQPGIYRVTVTESGCSNVDSFLFRTAVSNFFPPDTVLCKGDRLIPLHAGEPVEWQWNGQPENPPFLPDSTRAVQALQVFFSDGCVVADSIRTRFVPCGLPYFPNVFAPAGSAENAFFTASGLGFVPLASAIYNRWGELCYRSGPGEWPRWDGLQGGELAPSGVYIWICTVQLPTGIRQQLQGSVTLIR